MSEPRRIGGARGVAFLLAQLGSDATGKFARRLAPLDLKPSDAGILRLLGQDAGISQQELASRLRIHPSRIVAVVDELEARGLVARRPNAEDRRTHALHLTAKGRATLEDIGRISRDHNEEICAGLTNDEREQLASLLGRVAARQGLAPGVHPGYQQLGPGSGAHSRPR